MTSSSKKRGANFSLREKEILVAIIHQFSYLLESKKTDRVTMKEKEMAWESIAKKFNANGLADHRSPTEIKTFWDNLKRVTRKHFAAVRANVIRTGGRQPPKNIKDDPLLLLVKEIISGTVVPMANKFDGDFIPGVDDVPLNIIDIIKSEDEIVGVEDAKEVVDVTRAAASSSIITDPSWNPTMMRKPKSSRLNVSIEAQREPPATTSNVSTEAQCEPPATTSKDLGENRAAKRQNEIHKLHAKVKFREKMKKPRRLQIYEQLAEAKLKYVNGLLAQQEEHILFAKNTNILKKEIAEIEKQVAEQMLVNEKLKTDLLKKQLL